jgi:uncharacterized protein
MIAIDTNLLVYAHRRDALEHERARTLVVSLSQGSTPLAIPFHCIVEFYGIVTHPKIYVPPSTPTQAIEQVDAWLEAPAVRILTEEGLSSWLELKQILAGAAITGARTHDARIASVCLQHGVSELLSMDRDFSRFPALKVRNPLVAAAKR